MDNNNLEEEIIKKALEREKKKRKRMKVSGKRVFELKEIIKKKTK